MFHGTLTKIPLHTFIITHLVAASKYSIPAHRIPWIEWIEDQLFLTYDDYLNFADKNPNKQHLIMVFITLNEVYEVCTMLSLEQIVYNYRRGRWKFELKLFPVSVPVNIFKCGQDRIWKKITDSKGYQNACSFKKRKFKSLMHIDLKWLMDILEYNRSTKYLDWYVNTTLMKTMLAPCIPQDVSKKTTAVLPRKLRKALQS